MNLDRTECLRRQVAEALARHRPLRIVGGASRSGLAFLGGGAGLDILSTAGHAGIVEYDPAELVLTARAGTRLAEIEATLAAHGQMLPFEPPRFAATATLGGTVAAGLSGPRRPFAGSARDAVLGCRLLNGRAEVLSFGGRVIKNVAGFDLSRLMAGACGTLGVLLEISLRVLPRPESEVTRVFRMAPVAALTAMNRWCGQPWPFSALAHEEDWTFARLSGGESVLGPAGERLGGDPAADGSAFWERLRDCRGRFFDYPPLGERLWRLSVAPAAPVIDLPGHWLYDWGGAQRWLRSSAPPEDVFAAAARYGGHAILHRGRVPGERTRQGLPSARRALHERLKRAFDPHGLFNPHLFQALL